MLSRIVRAAPAAATTVVARAGDEIAYLRALVDAGFVRADRPATVAAALRAIRAEGPLGAALALPVARHPQRTAIVDERGATTFAELDRRTNALANAWRARGARPGDGVGLMIRNHAGFVEALFAVSKLGGRAILMNTDFAGPQLAEVAAREGVRLLAFDDEFADHVTGVDAPLGRFRAWVEREGDVPGADGTLDELIASAPATRPPAPGEHASLIILTSGTTGTPKGARRQQPKSLSTLGGLLTSVPLRSEQATVIATPMFHALGLAHAILAVGLGSTLVLRRRFDPALAVEDVARHRASGLIVVPIMLRRFLDAHDEAGRTADLSSLRVVFVAGSQLGGSLATRALDTLGEVVYNLYGSTEVAYATIAEPHHLRIAPDAVGPVVRGARVRILDDDGRDVPTGVTGRVFVGNGIPFEGYTGGGGKENVGGLLSSGDVGHFDEHGLLTIDGRDDDMIVSGGENVFPGEVEELLAGHDLIAEAAVVGVDDEQFGKRLRAYVVLREGARLDEQGVQQLVRENLARYKVPREVRFLDELPRNPTGKVLKRELEDVPA
ncbi:AMP-binding protein [Patulibacter defluvii]|uniref:AMP-binding protein n=1 Tax=Patulibacter defluvii TaxID=3095358 RepID=UPI002A75E832|nr:AMP-binding protein [Patulibacter sp. DM4]